MDYVNKIAIIDNYDSFTYNLVHLIEELIDTKIDVLKNDQFVLNELEKYEYLILSPGPGLPEDAGLLLDVVRSFGPSKKILGICLGMQAIGMVYGGQLSNLCQVFHGEKSLIHRTSMDSYLFKDMPTSFHAGRYHSWTVNSESSFSELEVTARDEQGHIMALEHKNYKVYGVQFHPESIMTPLGYKILSNYLDLQLENVG